MKRTPTRRLHRFLDRGGDAFIPPERMRAIRWEEAVLRSQVNRSDAPHEVFVQHGTCHCGSIDCVGVPHDTHPSMRWAPSPETPWMITVTFDRDGAHLARDQRASLRGLYKRWRAREVDTRGPFRLLDNLVSPDERAPEPLSIARRAAVFAQLREFGVLWKQIEVNPSIRVTDALDRIPRGIVVAIKPW